MGGNLKKTNKFRNIIFWGHLVAGLTAGLFILSSAVTGILLAFEPQIVEWAERGVRRVIAPPSSTDPLNPDHLWKIASKSFPDLKPVGITLKSDREASVAMSFGKEGVRFLNPYTGEVLGSGSLIHKWMHKIEDWHRWLGSKKIGKPITGASAIVFFILAISGLYLWWPKKSTRLEFRRAMSMQFNLEGKSRDWNWHTVIGFWCAPLILVTTLTGIVMSYEWANNLLYRATGNEPPAIRQMATENKPSKDAKKVSADDIAWKALSEQARQQAPDWVSINMRVPKEVDAPIVAWIEEKAVWWYPSPRSQLTMDPQTAEVLKWEPYTEHNRGRILRSWVKVLHTGEAWGFWGQILMALSAAGVVLLVYTGFALAYRRFFMLK